jgi:hypothetical protein
VREAVLAGQRRRLQDFSIDRLDERLTAFVTQLTAR